MTDDDHRELAEVNNKALGKIAISNYDCPLMDELYPAPKWKKHKQKTWAFCAHAERTEVLWTNYND